MSTYSSRCDWCRVIFGSVSGFCPGVVGAAGSGIVVEDEVRIPEVSTGVSSLSLGLGVSMRSACWRSVIRSRRSSDTCSAASRRATSTDTRAFSTSIWALSSAIS